MESFPLQGIMDYRIAASCPADELLTLGRVFAEAGSYASMIPDSAFVRMTGIRHDKVARLSLDKITSNSSKSVSAAV